MWHDVRMDVSIVFSEGFHKLVNSFSQLETQFLIRTSSRLLFVIDGSSRVYPEWLAIVSAPFHLVLLFDSIMTSSINVWEYYNACVSSVSNKKLSTQWRSIDRLAHSTHYTIPDVKTMFNDSSDCNAWRILAVIRRSVQGLETYESVSNDFDRFHPSETLSRSTLTLLCIRQLKYPE